MTRKSIDPRGQAPAAPPDEVEATPNPYRASRLVDLGIAERLLAQASSWRRLSFVLGLALTLSVGVNTVLASKSQHDVLVYRENSNGLQVMSEALNAYTPTQVDAEAQIVHWLRALRDVPAGQDYAVVDRNVEDVLASTASGSDADAKVREFLQNHNPKEMSNTLSRTVRNVRVAAVTKLTYELTWDESLVKNSHTTTRTFSGTVTIAPPQLPTNPAVAAVNPAGVYVTTYDLHWENP